MGPRRLRLRLVPRDLWVGAYISPHAVYVCPLPCPVIQWDRKVKR
jgi:hypothetical protein